MVYQKKRIFDWNHISDKLTEEQVDELKSYYHSYHRKCWAYKQALKCFKKWKLIGNSMSVIFASSGLAASIATGGVSLVAISTVSLLIQGWMQHQNLDLKIQNCTYAYQSYQHLLNSIKDMLRSGNYQQSTHLSLKQTDDIITDLCPVIDKYFLKYDKKFTLE